MTMTYYIAVDNPLPDPESVIDQSWNLAWPQVLAWSAAAVGVLIAIMIVKSFAR